MGHRGPVQRRSVCRWHVWYRTAEREPADHREDVLLAESYRYEKWIQTNNTIGHSVWDLGFAAEKAAVFNTIDHCPMPQEAIESTVYLSNDLTNWVPAVTQRVWLEGIYADTSLLWDGFVYGVGTPPGGGTFRYAAVIWGGPGALISDGDNEINGIMGLRGDFTPPQGAPEPGSLALLTLALAVAGVVLRRRRIA